MQTYKLLNVTRYISITLIIIGVTLFFYGYFVSGTHAITGVGIGSVMGAMFIFIMGLFLEVTTETILRHGK